MNQLPAAKKGEKKSRASIVFIHCVCSMCCCGIKQVIRKDTNQKIGKVRSIKIMSVLLYTCKFFTYVTKTRANLSTYSGELQWHHYFWDWYPEKVFPNQFKTDIFTVKTKMAPLFWCSHLMLSVVLQCGKNKSNKLVKKWSLRKILIDWGRLFYDLKINGAIVIAWLSTICK